MADGAAFSGLVPNSTSGKSGLEVIGPLARWKKLRKAVRESARLHELGRDRNKFYLSMLTCTYAREEGGEARDISTLLTHIRKYLQRRGLEVAYVWVAELQERGALHYHVLIWQRRGTKLPMPDQVGWWPHGSTEIAKAHSPVGYMTKYASKLRSKQNAGKVFPKGFRMHGCGGLDIRSREFRSHYLRPQWLRDSGPPELLFRPLTGGGFFSKVTGEVFPSPWIVTYVERRPGVGAVIHIRLKEQVNG